ncbi:DeoR/GlpR family DNA-binding transcription regulator [Adhaeretor mobilis]|uniref:DeoR/GlpR family DNA-binding transcription regulator n=1 Tax=Adhaeretor mobilis TaxID=1930276 RepID=UPI001C54CBB7|nr:DeoR/GlpR family DNA-binding transcription regulator [Adhaeretor mobilis]
MRVYVGKQVKNNTIPLARERRLEILAQLNEQGSVRVTSLAENYQVAEETIRRDLDKLHGEGRLARTHGGALSVRNDRFDLPVSVRKNRRIEEKQAIAKCALQYIQPNEVIALDASTSALELACLLPDMPLTVITNSIDAARLLLDRPKLQVISTGGQLNPQSACFLGSLAEATLRQFSIEKAFISCKGIDMARGYSEASTEHASLKRLLMKLADQTILLADHSKFGVRSMVYSGELQDVAHVVTDEHTDGEYLEALADAGVKAEVAANGSSA